MIKKLPVSITTEEFIKLIKNTKMEHHKISFLLGFGSGLRISEVRNLEARDVNIKEKKILVRQGKGSKDRVVPLPKGFKEKHLKMLPIKCSVRALQIAFKRSCDKARLLKNKPELHFHSLRHGFATKCISQGMPIHHVRTLLGHSNISTTNIYLEANPKEALKSYENLF
jgi:integrase/recombinase XerD